MAVLELLFCPIQFKKQVLGEVHYSCRGMKLALDVSALRLLAQFRFALQYRQLRPGIDTLPAGIASAPRFSTPIRKKFTVGYVTFIWEAEDRTGFWGC